MSSRLDESAILRAGREMEDFLRVRSPIFELGDDHDWAERLLRGDEHAVLHVREHGRLKEEPCGKGKTWRRASSSLLSLSLSSSSSLSSRPLSLYCVDFFCACTHPVGGMFSEWRFVHQIIQNVLIDERASNPRGDR